MKVLINGQAVEGSPGDIAAILSGPNGAAAPFGTSCGTQQVTGTDCPTLYENILTAAAAVATASGNLQAALDAYAEAGCEPAAPGGRHGA